MDCQLNQLKFSTKVYMSWFPTQSHSMKWIASFLKLCISTSQILDIRTRNCFLSIFSSCISKEINHIVLNKTNRIKHSSSTPENRKIVLFSQFLFLFQSTVLWIIRVIISWIIFALFLNLVPVRIHDITPGITQDVKQTASL